jgi:hypothetical protein
MRNLRKKERRGHASVREEDGRDTVDRARRFCSHLHQLTDPIQRVEKDGPHLELVLRAYSRLPSGDRQREAMPCERFLLLVEDEGRILDERLYDEVKSRVSSLEGGLMRLETVFRRSHTLRTLHIAKYKSAIRDVAEQ